MSDTPSPEAVPYDGPAPLDDEMRAGEPIEVADDKPLSPDSTIVIDPEFASLCPSPTLVEREQLERNIQADGCLTPLALWNCDGRLLLLDGHNRLEICRKHGLDFKAEVVKLPRRQAAVNWIIDNQLGRRNLSHVQRTALLGKKYNDEKKAAGGRADRDLSGDHDDTPKTADRLAKRHGVSAPTVKRAGKLAEAVDTLTERMGPMARKVLMSSENAIPKKVIVSMALHADNIPADLRPATEEEAAVALLDLARSITDSSVRPKSRTPKTECAEVGEECAETTGRATDKLARPNIPKIVAPEWLTRTLELAKDLSKALSKPVADVSVADAKALADELLAILTKWEGQQ